MKKRIKDNQKLSYTQKRNATSSIELIEYEMRAHKIQRSNPQNKLEQSFSKYLEEVKKLKI